MNLNLLRGFNRVWVVAAIIWWLYFLVYVPCWLYADQGRDITGNYREIFSAWWMVIYFVGAPVIVYALIRAIAFVAIWIARGFKANESN